MASMAGKLVLGAGAAALGLLAWSATSKADEKRRPGSKAPNAFPELFTVGPDGTVAFRPEVSAQLYNSLFQATTVTPEAENGVVEMTPPVPGNELSADWALLQNEQYTILAARSIVLPVEGLPMYLKAVPAGQEKFHTAGDNALFAVFALKGAIADMTGPGVVPSLPLPSRTPGDIPPMVPGDIDIPGAGMPGPLQAKFDEMLNSQTAGPEELLQVADLLEQAGYAAEAQVLREKAEALLLLQEIEEAEKGTNAIKLVGPNPPTAGHVAQYYTGDWTRWQEIVAANPGMQIVGTPPNQGPKPWYSGMPGSITLPSDWDTLKPPMAGTMLA